MAVIIRKADPVRDRPLLIELLRRNLNPRTDERRYDWLFLHAPAGPARLWLAVDDTSGEVIGSGGALPRMLFIDGTEMLGCVLADFWIDPRHRVLGPALKLQRACLAPVDDGSFALAYDMPRQSMGAVYLRLGVSLDRALVRMVRPLNLDRQIRERIGTRILGHAAAGAAGALLALRDAARAWRRRCEVVLAPPNFGPEFSALARDLAVRRTVWLARTDTYLNWRFGDHFNHRFEVLAARVAGQLAGYAVILETARSIDIVDLLWNDEPPVITDLVEATVQLGRRRRKDSVNAQVLDASPTATALAQAGFFPRERQPFVLYAPRATRSAIEAAQPKWQFTAGDEAD